MATYTTKGLNEILENGYTNYTYLGVGNGTPSGTALGGELDRNACTVLIVDDTMYIEALFSTAEAVDDELSEWAVFDAATNGNVLVYGAESPTVAKTSSKNLIVTIVAKLAGG